jgi:phenylpyruvate tautomerase PptA (4-oxalocrotonate tautomerase family)
MLNGASEELKQELRKEITKILTEQLGMDGIDGLVE